MQRSATRRIRSLSADGIANKHLRGGASLHQARDIVAAAQHDESVQRESPATRIVVDQPHDAETKSGVAPDVAQHGGARLSGAIQEDPFVPVLRRLSLAAVKREESALEPQHTETQERQDRPDDRHESRDHLALAHDAGDNDDREGGGAGQEQPARFLHARVLPHLPVEAEGRVRQQMDRKHDHDEDAEPAPVRRRHRAVEPHDEQGR